MESSHTSWWRRHGWTVALLLAAFGFSFAIRTIWAYPIIAQWGPLFTYGGGSDSYYHSRVMEYIILNHQNLIHDPLLRFPIGAINPREPLFDWMNAILGLVFAPFFGGNAVVAGSWFLDLQAPLWAALGVFPVYLIGREVAGRRVGLAAALIYPFLSANIDSTIFGYANYLSFYTFVILVVVYSYLRTLKAVGTRRWVDNYRDPRSVLRGLRGFLATERNAVKWAVFTGVSFGALALAWQGFTYAVVVIGISTLTLVIVERIRRVDSFGLYIATWIVGLVGFPMAMPYYIVQQQFHVWFDLPLLLFFGILLLLLPFMFLRDVPWIFSLPLTAGLLGLATGLLAIVNPGYFNTIVTGQGYFVKNLIYSTIAEVQAPSIDQLIVGYGVVTFFLSFVGIGLVVYEIIRHRFQRVYVVFLVFALLSFYLPISAAKFFEVGSPIFALLPAVVIIRALDIAGFPELRRTVASLSDRRSQLSAFRKAFKVRHVVLLLVVVGLVLPNIWVAIDAGIPANTKSQLSSQVASTLPTWLQPNTSNPSGYYFGAAGSALDTPNQYDSAGYNWLAQQNPNVPAPDRPAFVSWWDYGFQAIAQGNHPSVADNFQNGIDPAGQFLLSQNESQAIAVLATTLLQAEQVKSGLPYLPAGLNTVLQQDGLNLSMVHTLMVNTSADYTLVVGHPDRYLPVDPSTLTDLNAMYLAMEYYLATTLPLSKVAHLYNDVQSYTGWSIAYAMADTRLFPFSGTNTGIFYAPAELTGRVINSAGLPTSFFNVTVLGSDGQTYPAGQVPAGVTPINYTVNYFPAFYNSMIYHIYIGYNGTDAGLGTGIPGLGGTSAAVSAPLMPGWMLQHFQVVYKTAYYCPQKNPSAGSSCFVATNFPQAVALAARGKGTADTNASAYFSGGESMLQYYPGQTLLGTVTLPDGTPVSGASVTVDDGWGIPHMRVVTGADGTFQLVLPPGNDTVNITIGSINGLRQQGSDVLASIPIPVSNTMGLSYNAPALVRTFKIAPATVNGFVYWNSNNTSAYSPSADPLVPSARVVLWGDGLARLDVTTDASGSFQIPNVPAGVYNVTVLYGGENYSQPAITVSAGGVQNITAGLVPGYFEGTVKDLQGGVVYGAQVTLSNASGVVATTTTNLTGAYSIRSVGPGNYTVLATGPTPGTRSAGVPVVVSVSGTSAITNLTVEPMAALPVVVRANGIPASAISVRLSPVPTFSSTSPLTTLKNVSGTSTTFTTGRDGSVLAVVPAGTYSVYATGYVGSSLYAATAEVTIGAATSPASLTLNLGPALPLSGTVAPYGSTLPRATAVVAYGSSGGPVVGWANSTGAFSMWLPAGRYTLAAYSGSLSSATGVGVALSSISLTAPATVALDPVASVMAHLDLGALLPDGTYFAAANATLSLSVGVATGPSVPLLAGPDGSVTFYAPTVVPDLATSYCLSADAVGFAFTSICGISPNGLGSLSRLPLALTPVSMQISVTGLPSGSTATVTLNATEAPAIARTLSGASAYSFLTTPGRYSITAEATLANGTVYRSEPGLVAAIPLGASTYSLSVRVVPQVLAHGTLTPPPVSLPLVDINVTLSSPSFNESVNGTAYTTGFYAPVGTYSAYSVVGVGKASYANLTRVTIDTSGQVQGSISLLAPGWTLDGTVVNAAGQAVNLTTVATLTASNGAVIPVPIRSGAFNLTTSPNAEVTVGLSATALAPGPNGSYAARFTNAPGASCSVTANPTQCTVTLIETPIPVTFNASLTVPGVSGTVAGSLMLVGPYPSTTATKVTTSSGSVSIALLPGAYSVYAVGGPAGSPWSLLTSLDLLTSTPGTLDLTLAPSWAVGLTLSPPSGSSASIGPVGLTVRSTAGPAIVLANLTSSSSLLLSLPVGTYRASGVAAGTLYGVPTAATGNVSFSVLNGNLAVPLGLTLAAHYGAAGRVIGAGSATVTAGGLATFSFQLNNTGNMPEVVHAVGSPAYWNFTFSSSSVSLVPGGPNASLEVTVRVPAGTAVGHPAVGITLELANGTVIGSVNPAPVVNVVGYYGLRIGPYSTSPVQVGATSIQVPFYLSNLGNQPETVTLSEIDQPRLTTLGWTANFVYFGNNVTSVTLQAGQNSSASVHLTPSAPLSFPPGSVLVSASVANASGGLTQTVTLSVPYAKVIAKSSVGSPPVTVSGPSVTAAPSALPDWVVPVLSFVPAIALAVGLVVYRWWRTRRWTRR